MKSDYVDKDILGHLLYALTPSNMLVCKLCLETGLRLGDVLNIKTSQLQQKSFTITEQKTKKKRKVSIREPLRKELLNQAGDVWCFPHRTDKNKHRTRQAVYTDLKRAAKLFRLKVNVSPHSIRKLYAVDLYHKTGDLRKVQAALQHDDYLTTIIYALADELTKKKK